jgi:hypothetical protein
MARAVPSTARRSQKADTPAAIAVGLHVLE